MKRRFKNRRKSYSAVRTGSRTEQTPDTKALVEKIVGELTKTSPEDRKDIVNALLAAHDKVMKLKPAEIEAWQKKQQEAEEEAQKKKKLDEEEESWKLTAEEIANRVRSIRHDIDAAKARYEGTMFDILTEGSEPRSLNTREPIREPYELVNFLCPALEGHYNRAGTANDEYSLSYLQWVGMEVGFQVGVLAGFIFAGASDQDIDRAERGLVHASIARKM